MKSPGTAGWGTGLGALRKALKNRGLETTSYIEGRHELPT